MKNIITIMLLMAATFTFGQTATTKDTKTQYRTYAYGGLAIGRTLNSKVIDSAVVINNRISFYKSGVILNPEVTSDTISLSEIPFEASRILTALGVQNKVLPLSLELGGGAIAPAMGDGNIYYNLVLIRRTTTISSFTFTMSTSFVGTGDNTNNIAFMRISSDTLYKIAETPNNPDIWKAVAGTPTTVNVTTPVTVQPGIYVIACIYNNSAQTTAPSMQGIGATTWYNYMLPNSMKISGYSSTSTNTSIPAFVKQSAIYPTSSSYVIIAN